MEQSVAFTEDLLRACRALGRARVVMRNPVGVVVPKFITGDLMAEYGWRDFTFKASLLNVTDAHYADFLYRGHYVPGRGRTALFTVSYRF